MIDYPRHPDPAVDALLCYLVANHQEVMADAVTVLMHARDADCMALGRHVTALQTAMDLEDALHPHRPRQAGQQGSPGGTT